MNLPGGDPGELLQRQLQIEGLPRILIGQQVCGRYIVATNKSVARGFVLNMKESPFFREMAGTW
jgi:hypothetical protein